MSVAIGPRFSPEELAIIDRLRGPRTRARFVYECVTPYLQPTPQPPAAAAQAPAAPPPTPKKHTVLTHECETAYNVMPSGPDVFLICPKCHTSKRLSKEDYEKAQATA